MTASFRCAALAAPTIAFTAALAGAQTPAAPFDLERVSNGFGELLPHKVLGGPSGAQLIEIRSLADLLEHATPTSPILPVAAFPPYPLLPNATAGNHYVVVELSGPIDIASVLTAAAQPSSQLTGAVSFEAVDPATGLRTQVGAAAFVNGQAYLNPDPQSPGQLLLETHVAFDSAAQKPVALTPAGVGFPFTQDVGSIGLEALVSEATLVLVADTDGDLSTHETFPAGLQLALRLGADVKSVAGEALASPVLASMTVGPDQLRPELSIVPSAGGTAPAIVPPPGATDVDPTTDVTLTFTESLQPWSVGPLFANGGSGEPTSTQIVYAPTIHAAAVPYTATPAGPYDLGTWTLDLAWNLPGDGGVAGTGVDVVSVTVAAQTVRDLVGQRNQAQQTSSFDVGAGVGLVNAPVAPDAIYVGRAGLGGGASALSVIDLNGFGAGTGNPAYDAANPIQKGASNYPNNPNVMVQGSTLFPPLAPGSSTLDGGSAGVFTLTLDSNLNDRLLTAPAVDTLLDLALGGPLDTVFNNGPAPFGCQVGSPNLCAISGLKQPAPVFVGGSLQPAAPGQFTSLPVGTGNLISWAPHPNPPPLVFPPPCISPDIGGQEPTSTFSSQMSNLLAPGDPFGDPASGLPPSGLLSTSQTAFFVGPSPPAASVVACAPMQIRQQVGHFLYAVDAGAAEVVAVNSNRMTVLDRIAIDAPTSLAVAPNLNFLAVASSRTGRLSIVDIDPASATFHQVVTSVDLGAGLSDVVWQPDGEDILVANERTNELVVVSAFNFQVRKLVATGPAGLRQPFRIAATNRQAGFGLGRNVYFAFVLGRNGRLAVFESGPDGANGWGSDALLATDAPLLSAPRDLRIDPGALNGAVWVAHERPIDPATGAPTGQNGGALTRLELSSPVIGQLPLGTTPALSLADRQLSLDATDSIGEGVLTGIPVSLSFDEQVNLGGLTPPSTPYAASPPIPANSKSLVRFAVATIYPTRSPRFLFAAVPNSSQGGDAVDVIDLTNGLQRIDTDAFTAGVQSIPIDGVRLLVDWFGQ